MEFAFAIGATGTITTGYGRPDVAWATGKSCLVIDNGAARHVAGVLGSGPEAGSVRSVTRGQAIRLISVVVLLPGKRGHSSTSPPSLLTRSAPTTSLSV